MTQNSVFASLYRYAKASHVDSVENYTTEALAGCIRLSPEPFLRWLADEEVIPAGSALVAVETQRAEAEGILDLVVETSAGARYSRTIFEIKVDAGQSGNQLARYAQLVARWTTPTLDCTGPIVLARHPLDTDHRFVSWHALRRYLDAHAPADLLWREFSRYLAERHLSDSYDDPITMAEATALGPAHQLLGKMSRSLHELLTELREQGGALKEFADWYPGRESDGRSSIRTQLGRQLTQHGRLATHPRRGSVEPVLVCFIGAWPSSTGSGHTELGIWFETDPKESALQRSMAEEARRCGLADLDWRFTASGGWQFLHGSVPLVTLGSEVGIGVDRVRDSLRQRVEELARFGMLDVILHNWRARVTRADDEEEG